MPGQDKQQKDRDEDERDEDERDEDDSDDASDDDDERDEAKAKARKADEDDSDDSDDADDSDDSDEDDGERDEAAQRVAKSLGVGGDEAEGDAKEAAAEGEAEETEAEAAQPNRAARRREEALARRKKRSGAATTAEATTSPKDKNSRAKELLKRRREQAAATEREPVASSLDAGELVDDALARRGSAISTWLKSNLQIIQWVVLAGIVGAGGYFFYMSRVEKGAAEASSKLAAGIAADRGVVVEEDKRSDDEKEYDTRKVFKTSAEQADAELNAFGGVIEKHGGSGAALLAKLGQGGAYLEKKDFDKAIASYSEVLASPLAAADPDVKGRAVEGTAFAKEGKGDLDGALASFKELGSIDLKGYKELATYHEARVSFAKGDKAKAKELLEPLNTKLSTPTPEPQPLNYLKGAVGDLLAQIDPSAVAAPAKPPPGAKMPTPEELQDMARRALQKQQAPAPEAPKP